jgi:pimeloyl-ACP methyl ester carboxylesterase
MSNHFSAANLKFPGDLVALMDALGHQRFAMHGIGIDTGMPIAYALAADHPTDSTVWSSHSTNLYADSCPKKGED